MVFVGFGFAFCMVSSFGRAHFAAITKGFNDDMDTYIFVSGRFQINHLPFSLNLNLNTSDIFCRDVDFYDFSRLISWSNPSWI